VTPGEILFNEGCATSPEEITKKIVAFGDGYNNAAKEIIEKSKVLDNDGIIFIDCATRILSSFGMTRSGPFHMSCHERLWDCWNTVGIDLIEIKDSMLKSGLSRDRYMADLGVEQRDELIAKIWLITKKLLPFTMGGSSYGLVGASKILFSVLPEIALPVDNTQWLHVFKTVDFGDVLHRMVLDIQQWEKETGSKLNDVDDSRRLTTLPAVYNVMAMYARHWAS
jgi:hypothetical protein